MELFSARGDGADALLVYDELRRRLRDELGIAPSQLTQAVYKRLLLGEPRAECFERLLGSRLLRVLLGAPGSAPELLPVDRRGAEEVAVVRRPLHLEHRVADLPARLRERLLQGRLVVDVLRAGVLDPVGERGDDRPLDRLVAVLEEERRNRGLEQSGGDVPALDDARRARQSAISERAAFASRSPSSSSRATAAQLCRETTCERTLARRPSDASG